jgi:Ca2+-binding EF-hand superfamily protein
LKVAFEVFDLNGDGFIELEDMIGIAKSGLLASIIIMNQYTEEEPSSRATKSFDKTMELNNPEDNVKVTAKEVDLTLHVGGKVANEMRIPQEPVQASHCDLFDF